MPELDNVHAPGPELDGKRRRLARLQEDGHFAILAIDHTESLRDALDNTAATDDDAIASIKLELIRNLAPSVTAVLIDPMVGARPALERHAVDSRTGLILSLEELDYSQPYAKPALMPNWGAHQALVAGADAAKLLVYYRPDGSDAGERETFVRKVAETCAELQLPLLLEPLPYPDPSDPPHGVPAEIAIEIARCMALTGADVLKLPFPAGDDTEAARTCTAINDTVGDIPWVLLSQGVASERYTHQLSIAAETGASGYAVGRSAWGDLLRADRNTQLKLGRERLAGYGAAFGRVTA